MGGKDEVKETGAESSDAGYANTGVRGRVPGRHADAGARGEGVGRAAAAVGAGGGGGGGAAARGGAAAGGHADHDVVDDAVPDAPVHGDGPLPGVEHLTQARADPREHEHETLRRPFPSYVSSMLPFDFRSLLIVD